MKIDNNRKTVIIGLDGATFRILQPLIKEGYLPNISDLINNGVSGLLKSVYPPISCVAWASFMTGKNPGKHGIYSWSRRQNGSYNFEKMNSSFIQEPTLWDIASVEGKNVIVINVPMTYPPQRVNGVMLGDMLSPRVDQNFMYPPDLFEEIVSNVGEYVLDVYWQNYTQKRVEQFLQDLTYCTQKRAETGFYLMDKFEWDFFTIVFTETDRLQHFLWNIMDETHPRFDEKKALKYQTMIWEYYQFLDDIIGKFSKNVEADNADIFVISDHGFGPVDKEFYINRWLVEEGLLVLKDARKTQIVESVKSFLHAMGVNRKRVNNLLRRFKQTEFAANINKQPAINQLIDWEKTKAYSIYAHGININLVGREPQGIVKYGREYEKLRDFIIEELMNFRDANNGRRIIEKVLKQEDIYCGNQISMAPDLILECGDNPYCLKHGSFEEKSIFKTVPQRNGTHTTDGIFIARGKNIKRGKTIDNAQLIDVLPTILYNMGLSLLDDFDGQILNSIFDEKFTQENPPAYQSGIAYPKYEQPVFNSKDEKAIEERLKGLGYM